MGRRPRAAAGNTFEMELEVPTYSLEKAAEALREAIKEFERAGVELAAQGWTVPIWFTPDIARELLKDRSAKRIDAVFVRVYQEKRARIFGEVSRDLLRRPTLKVWRPLLLQVFRAHRRKDFRITIPALLSIVEGLLMQGEGTSTKVKAEVERRVAQQGPGSLNRSLWRTVQVYVEELFRNSDFTGVRPHGLNRHWILHGRDNPAQWTCADGLRLIQAIDTLSGLLRPEGDPWEE